MTRCAILFVATCAVLSFLIGIQGVSKPWQTPRDSKTPDQEVIGHFFGPEP